MSHLPGNPHIPDALMQLRQATNGSINAAHASAILAAAQTNATLALAYEQRTANLIAIWTAPESFDAQLTKAEWADVKHQIKSRLGINEGATE